jgi:hypothetical protein
LISPAQPCSKSSNHHPGASAQGARDPPRRRRDSRCGQLAAWLPVLGQVDHGRIDWSACDNRATRNSPRETCSCLVHVPPRPDRVPRPARGTGQQRGEPLHPPEQAHVVDLHTAFGQQLLNIPVGQPRTAGTSEPPTRSPPAETGTRRKPNAAEGPDQYDERGACDEHAGRHLRQMQQSPTGKTTSEALSRPLVYQEPPPYRTTPRRASDQDLFPSTPAWKGSVQQTRPSYPHPNISTQRRRNSSPEPISEPAKDPG